MYNLYQKYKRKIINIKNKESLNDTWSVEKAQMEEKDNVNAIILYH